MQELLQHFNMAEDKTTRPCCLGRKTKITLKYSILIQLPYPLPIPIRPLGPSYKCLLLSYEKKLVLVNLFLEIVKYPFL